MNKGKMIVLIGLPGSGKSQWAETRLFENLKAFRVNWDSLRKELGHTGKILTLS